jgi:hypothetical protein
MRRQISNPKLQIPGKFQAPTLKGSASLTVPPLSACGERIEVRGFDQYAKNPHPALSLSKGEATKGAIRFFAVWLIGIYVELGVWDLELT